MRGFSLVELAIVLVILGLLIGGVLSGQSLIRAAELRAVVTESARFQTSAQTFRDKYFSLPGDMTNAESFWGTMATGSCPNATAGTGTQTCNGNGDGAISNAAGASMAGERLTFWQHLANAGLIEGQYSGISGPGTGGTVLAGQNAPRSRLGSTIVWDASSSADSGSTYAFNYPYNNFLRLGAQTGTSWNYGAAITPAEAWNVDKKMDDGKATQGKVWAVRWADCTPAASAGDFQDYNLSASGLRCGLVFHDAF